MKARTVGFLLAVVMVFSFLQSVAFAENDKGAQQDSGNCTIRISQTAAKPGETVTVSLSIENNPGILGATLTVSWDAGLTLTEMAENGEAFSTLGLTAPETKLTSPYNLIWYTQNLKLEDIKDGVIATLKFKVSEQAAVGQTFAVNASYVSGNIFDTDWNDVLPIKQNGGVTVVGAEHTHSYAKQVTTESYLASAATCTEAAKYYYSCECGEKGASTFSFGNPLGHNYVSGVCTRCHTPESVGNDCAIQVQSLTAEPGETVSVEISIKNNPGILGATLTVTWDDGLTLTEMAENGEAFSALGLTAPETKLTSPYNLVWYTQKLKAEDIKDGVIATLKFKVSEQAADGQTFTVNVSYVTGNIFDAEWNDVLPIKQNGSITVVSDPRRGVTIQADDLSNVKINMNGQEPLKLFVAAYDKKGRFVGTRIITSDAVLNLSEWSNLEIRGFLTEGSKPICERIDIH